MKVWIDDDGQLMLSDKSGTRYIPVRLNADQQALLRSMTPKQRAGGRKSPLRYETLKDIRPAGSTLLLIGRE